MTIIKEVFLVLCLKVHMPKNIIVAPPRKESEKRVFSLILYNFFIERCLSIPKVTNAVIFIIIK